MTRIKKRKTSSRPSAELMEELDIFCNENNIKHNENYDSFYFELDGKQYRVSNHRVEDSIYWNWKKHKVDNHHFKGEIKGGHDYNKQVKCYYAYPSRLKQIYSDIKLGIQLDNTGRRR